MIATPHRRLTDGSASLTVHPHLHKALLIGYLVLDSACQTLPWQKFVVFHIQFITGYLVLNQLASLLPWQKFAKFYIQFTTCYYQHTAVDIDVLPTSVTLKKIQFGGATPLTWREGPLSSVTESRTNSSWVIV